jgi:hypothetical protein
VIVVALVSGNDTVALIDAVVDHGVDQVHDIVPVPGRGHDHG